MFKNRDKYVSHWWIQRVLAVLIIPLSLWFFFSFLKLAISSDNFTLRILLSNKFYAVTFLMLMAAAFYHAVLGIQVICEDYLSSILLRILFLSLVRSISLITFFFVAFIVLFSIN